MREINFRAWDKEENKMWFSGMENEYGSLVFWDRDPKDVLAEFTGFFANKNFIVMQYTGLKDKNGKEIYEGDILKDSRGGMSVVKWSEDICDEYGCVGWSGVSTGHYGGDPNTKVEVIGNVYESPDLLEKND